MTSTAHQSSYECPICCSSFKTKSTLTEHIKSVHDRKKCHNCNASILSPLDSECFVCSTSFSTNKCVVPSCKTTGLQSNFVHFPKNCVDRNAWKKILGVENVLKNSQVCDKHFKPVDFIKISKISNHWAFAGYHDCKGFYRHLRSFVCFIGCSSELKYI